MPDAAKQFARELARLERRIQQLERARPLARASVVDDAINVYDTDGTLRQTIGQQEDGTYTAVDHNGTPPPKPSTPVVTPVPGGLAVTWDGTTFDGSTWPTDFKRVEAHASTTSGFTATDETHVFSFLNTKGGQQVLIGLDEPTYYFRFVAVNTSGVESEATNQAAGSPDTSSGGQQVFFNASTSPPAGPFNVNDLWFKADLGYAPFRWDGDEWLAYQYGANAIADGTIVAAHIAAGTITGDRLTATAIDGKTITGSRLRTAATGARVELGTSGSIRDILLYSGSVDELEPGVIGHSSGGAFIRLLSPEYDVEPGSRTSLDIGINGSTFNLNDGREATVGVSTGSAQRAQIGNVPNGVHLAFGLDRLKAITGSWDTTIPIDASAFNVVSDIEQKSNLVPVEGADALDVMNAVTVYDYETTNLTGRQNADGVSTQRGVVAQDLAAVAPGLVSDEPDGAGLRVDLYGLLTTAVAAIQTLSAEVDALKAQLDA